MFFDMTKREEELQRRLDKLEQLCLFIPKRQLWRIEYAEQTREKAYNTFRDGCGVWYVEAIDQLAAQENFIRTYKEQKEVAAFSVPHITLIRPVVIKE